MLKQRLVVAGIGLPLLGLLLLAPERAFSAVIALLIAVGAFEVARAALPGASPTTHVGAAVLAALLVSLARGIEWFNAGTLVPAVGVALYLVLRPGAAPEANRPTWWLVAATYPGVLGAHFVLLRVLPEGTTWLVVLLAATFATDTGAYAVGRLLGRHRMAPAISPGKTWEGAAGGFVAGALATFAATRLLEAPPTMLATAAIALALPVVSEAGDLLESTVKRRIGVKDMSRLLPGHGGIMDRLDSLLATGPTLYWLVRWFVL
ncbi:MAG: phosphatidate cytidylyltransferase [Dehalococcoidia bacterium]|nr:phosphatidate cytidylyltransferase [Dehalococcoidia bacterium]